MPRSLWSGSLSFGLVTVPVKLVSAVQQKEIRFHQVHVADGGRIRYKRVCEVDGEEVAPEEIAKVDESGVLVTQEELDAVGAEKSDVVDILDFVKLDEVDPLYFDKPYYLLPGKGGDKAYRLLVEAMRAKGRAAVARIVFRGKEKLCAVRALDNALTLTMLNYGDEVILPAALEGVPEKGKLDKREVGLAGDLIEHLAAGWDPEKYRDEHRARVQDLLDAKREGGILVPTPPEKRAATVDLAKALEASLAAARGKKASG